ncbi:MAG: hypothetical protein KDC83_00500 [Flavobacteriales bacterium]|nr:hypothetical protein [Flavobacteriales bacterium]
MNPIKLILFWCFAGFLVSNAMGQRYTQAGKVHTFIQTSTKDDVAIRGNSTDAKIDYSQGGTQMFISLDPHTIITDNIEFNQQLEKSNLGLIEMLAEVDVSRLQYQSRYNEVIEAQAVVTFNNQESNVLITLIVTNKKTNDNNTYSITGTGELNVDDHKLHDIFPNIGDKIAFEFTQFLSASLR